MGRLSSSFSLSPTILLVALCSCTLPGTDPAQTTLDRAFQRAADDHGVPIEVLQAIGWAETRWQMVEGDDEHDVGAAPHGLMAIRADRLERAAELADVPVNALDRDLDANLAAAAALLAADAAELGIDAGDLGAWAPVIVRYAGLGDPEAEAEYIHHEVYVAINQGVEDEQDGAIVGRLAPHAVEADWPLPTAGFFAATDFPGAMWRPSPNQGSRGDAMPRMIIIHTCEGGYAGCWATLTKKSSKVSAHYVVSDRGELSQLVRETGRAFHIGADYQCSRNGDALCELNGQQSNGFTIGIEHAGYAGQKTWPAAELDASARLACDISREYGIPIDRQHVVGHGQLQPYNRSDPGKNWPWDDYLGRIAAACADRPTDDLGGDEPPQDGGGEIVIDSDTSQNDPAIARLVTGTSWTRSTKVGGFFGASYRVATASATEEPTSFWFFLAGGGRRTVETWWTTGTDRSAAAPHVVFNNEGIELGRVAVDQSVGGGGWATLGTFDFSPGWNRVSLLRTAPDGGVVVADAVRVR